VLLPGRARVARHAASQAENRKIAGSTNESRELVADLVRSPSFSEVYSREPPISNRPRVEDPTMRRLFSPRVSESR